MRNAIRKWIAALLAAGIAFGGFPAAFARADANGGESPTASPVLIETLPTPSATPVETPSPTEPPVAESPAAESPSPSPDASASPAPSASPTLSPEPSAAPTETPEPTATPSLIALSVSLSGPARVAKGRSADYTATVLPETALDRGVVWSIVSLETEAGELVPSPTPAPTPTEAEDATDSDFAQEGAPAPSPVAETPSPAPSPEATITPTPTLSPSPAPTPVPAPIDFSLYGVSLSEDGRLTVDGSASAARVTIRATANDGGAVAELTILLPERSARGVSLRSNDPKALASGRMRDTVKLLTKNVPSGDFDTAEAPNDESRLQLSAYAEDGETLLLSPEWESSDESVATVDETGLVRATGAGKAALTCRAGDGGSAEAKLYVHVSEPAARVSIAIDGAPMFEDAALLTFGSGARLTATAYTAQGDVCSAPITYDYAVFSFDADGNYLDDMTAEFGKKKLVSVSDYGTLKISFDLARVWERDTASYTMWITARAKDGGGAVATLPARILPKTTFITAEGSRHITLSLGETATLRFLSDAGICSYRAELEVPGVLSLVGGFRADEYPYTALGVKALTPGETKLTVRATDGSTVSLTYVITVLG